MTYGENSGSLRVELATLLRQHRVQQRIGGPGIHTVPESTTPTERQALGEQIRRYRHMALVWCHQAVRSTTPSLDPDTSSKQSLRRPIVEFRNRLAAAIEASTVGLPSMDELTTTQEFAMVETWRRTARAAALGEHDFDAGVDYGRLSDAQCATVITDAAEITRGLIVLDSRYRLIPGWKSLKGQRPLGLAAERCAHLAGPQVDHTVDLQGWRRTATTIDDPARPGISGALQAEHNLLIQLAKFPSAYNLRLVLDSQRVVSHEVSVYVREVAPNLAETAQRRAQTYTNLVRATRDLGGRFGSGGLAAAEGANAIGRLQRLPRDPAVAQKQLGHLSQIFNRIDTRVSDIMTQGVRERFYFLRVKLPHLAAGPSAGLKRPLQRYVPISSPDQTDLLAIVANQLRPPRPRPALPAGAAQSRRSLHEAITHRPEPRAPGLSH